MVIWLTIGMKQNKPDGVMSNTEQEITIMLELLLKFAILTNNQEGVLSIRDAFGELNDDQFIKLCKSLQIDLIQWVKIPHVESLSA